MNRVNFCLRWILLVGTVSLGNEWVSSISIFGIPQAILAPRMSLKGETADPNEDPLSAETDRVSFDGSILEGFKKVRKGILPLLYRSGRVTEAEFADFGKDLSEVGITKIYGFKQIRRSARFFDVEHKDHGRCILKVRGRNSYPSYLPYLRLMQRLQQDTPKSIQRVFAFSHTQKMDWWIQEWVEGSTLLEVLQREGPLQPHQVQGILRGMQDGLEYFYSGNEPALYVDKKTDNIIVQRDQAGGMTSKWIDLELFSWRNPSYGARDFAPLTHMLIEMLLYRDPVSKLGTDAQALARQGAVADALVERYGKGSMSQVTYCLRRIFERTFTPAHSYQQWSEWFKDVDQFLAVLSQDQQLQSTKTTQEILQEAREQFLTTLEELSSDASRLNQPVDHMAVDTALAMFEQVVRPWMEFERYLGLLEQGGVQAGMASKLGFSQDFGEVYDRFIAHLQTTHSTQDTQQRSEVVAIGRQWLGYPSDQQALLFQQEIAKVLGNFNAGFLGTLGYVADLHRPWPTARERVFLLYQEDPDRREIEETDEGPVTVRYVEQVTESPDRLFHGPFGWSSQLTNDVIVNSKRIALENSTVSFNLDLIASIITSQSIQHPQEWGQSHMEMLALSYLHRGFAALRPYERIQFQEISARVHEVEHERRRRKMKRLYGIPVHPESYEEYGLGEELAELRSMQKGESFHVISHVIMLAHSERGYAWSILGRLTRMDTSEEQEILSHLDRLLEKQETDEKWKQLIDAAYQAAERDWERFYAGQPPAPPGTVRRQEKSRAGIMRKCIPFCHSGYENASF